jgi:hypothetical protein
MRKILRVTALTILMAIISSGCVSYSVLEGSRERVALRKAIATNNEAAIQSLKSGNSPQMAGIKVTTWEAASERGLLQAGAGIADALIIWGGYEGVEWLADQGGDDSSSSDDNSSSRDSIDVTRDSIDVTINGDGNDVDVNTGTNGGSEE